MAINAQDQILQLQQAITAQESLRPMLGDAVVNTAIAALRQQLNNLQAGLPREQRKQVTVLFADLAGFTGMAEEMDPEDVHYVMNAYFGELVPAITRYGGVVEKFIGDAVMAVFGVPAARESDPENAVRAGLTMHQAINALNEKLRPERGIQLNMRVGINTGQVVVSLRGEEEDGAFVVLGDTVNVASRLQEAAPVGGVLISHDTYRHVRGIFQCRPLEPLRVKGRLELVPVYLVLEAKPRAFRLPSRGVWGLETRTIGRRAELEQLQNALQHVLQRQEMQVVTIAGDAGVGKSRLLYEFRTWLQLQPESVTIFNGRASQEMRRLPYSLMRELFAFRFEIQDSDPLLVAREKLEAGIVQAMGEEGRAKAPFLGHLFGVDFTNSSYLQGILDDARQIRDRAFHYTTQYFAAVSRVKPVAVYLEDLQWADDSSLDLVEYLVHTCAGLPILFICLTRPSLFDRRPNWSQNQPFHHRIMLQPLNEEESRELVAEILRKVPHLPPALPSLIVKRAGGNPYFIEELVKMLVDDGVIVTGPDRWLVQAERLAEVRVPPTLTGILQARLDSLPLLERETLQRASVVGRVFWTDAVRNLRSDSQLFGGDKGGILVDEISHALESLERKELIFKRDVSAFAGSHEYIFKNTILHEVTYESVLKRRRRIYHGQAASWLIGHSGERADRHAGLIGEHFEQAAAAIKAAEWYGLAAKKAQDTFAPETAITYYQKALSLLPEGANAAWLINWYEGLGEMLHWQLRYQEALQIYQAMRTAAEKAGDMVATARAWNAIAWVQDLQGEYRAALESAGRAEQLLRVAAEGVLPGHPPAPDKPILGATPTTADDCEAERIRAELGRALFNKGWIFYRLGDGEMARHLGEQALAISTVLRHWRDVANSMNLMGNVYSLLNHQAEAADCYHQALEMYQESGDRRGVCAVLNNLGETARLNGDYSTAVSLYQEAIVAAREIGYRDGELLFLSNMGGALVGLGEYQAAEQELNQVIATGDTAGTGTLCETYRFLAEAHLGQGRVEQSLEAARHSLSLAYELEVPEALGTAWRTLGQVAAYLNEPITVELWSTGQAALQFDAVACFAESWQVFRELGLEGEQLQTLRAWADYEAQRGDKERSRLLWEGARQLADRLGVNQEDDKMGSEEWNSDEVRGSSRNSGK
jgi:class 3 adenylate cyclase/tetratricopeptide (TPR) repeat protein